jgi:hypothetical protein
MASTVKKGKGTKITEKRLLEVGFVYRLDECEIPDELYRKHDIVIWNWNNEHWLVEALDQGGIDVEFKTMEQLAKFFEACGRDMYAEEKQ